VHGTPLGDSAPIASTLSNAFTHVCACTRTGGVQAQLDEAVRSLTDAGIHVVVAAGNEDADACDTSPAREPSAVTVGASTEQDRRLWLAPGGRGGRAGLG
jgi:cerevisin